VPPQDLLNHKDVLKDVTVGPTVVSESLATSDEITVWAQLSVTVPPSELGVGDEAKVI
jgi:hypothetical protein